jgi:hypothetical protein
LVVNEIPQIRRLGYRLRLSLYAFCVCSFLIYFVPIIVGRMGHWVFALSMVLSALFVWWVAGQLVKKDPAHKSKQIRLFVPAGGLIIIIIVFYILRLIPPVPLSVKYQGIFHNVERTEKGFIAQYPKPPFYAFWRDDSRPFKYRPGDSAYFLTRIFGPRGFKHQVRIRWSLWDPKNKEYVTTDNVPLNIVGGRDKGFRGFVQKSNVQAGRWKVSAETEDGRVIGYLTFKIKLDTSDKQRKWKTLKM